MKKIAVFVLVLSLCLPLLFGCSSSLSVDETETLEEVTKEEVTKEEETKEATWDPDSMPEGFAVGYSRVDISPELPIHTYDGAIAHKIHDPLQMTCTAMSDGEGIFLLFNLDLRGIANQMADYSAQLLEKKLGIPAERVFLNCSHTHTSVDTTDDPDVLRWRSEVFFKQLPVCAIEALNDLKPAKAFGGVSLMEEGVTFVRRYLTDNGTYVTNAVVGAVAHESEADREMRTIRFEREGGKDVVVVNYQTHYGSVSSLYPDSVSADWVHPFRENTEAELDCHFAYINGAGGNLNFQSPFEGERKYSTFEKAIPSFVQTVKDCIGKEEKLATGKIQSEISVYNGKKLNGEGTRELTFRAVGIGDMGFAAAPYEMFDMHGVQIRQESPYKMTFISAYTGGRNSYVPHAEGYEHGGYEAEVSYFAPGSGEEFVGELLRMLNVCKNKG